MIVGYIKNDKKYYSDYKIIEEYKKKPKNEKINVLIFKDEFKPIKRQTRILVKCECNKESSIQYRSEKIKLCEEWICKSCSIKKNDSDEKRIKRIISSNKRAETRSRRIREKFEKEHSKYDKLNCEHCNKIVYVKEKNSYNFHLNIKKE